MFRSRLRPVIIPQEEHQRFAGVLAEHWGNDVFHLPAVDPAAFGTGVSTHDRAFGALDILPIGEISEDMRAQQVQTWIETAHPDPQVELVVLHHVRRLFTYRHDAGHVARLTARIKDVADQAGLDLLPFEQADTITALCDGIAFDVAFESPTTRHCQVYQAPERSAEIDITFANGTVTVAPWPFRIAEITIPLTAYGDETYPTILSPQSHQICIKP